MNSDYKIDAKFYEKTIIAIDGPSASGKTALSKKIAEYYNIPCLNTGKIYRFIAFNLIKNINNIEYNFSEDDCNNLFIDKEIELYEKILNLAFQNNTLIESEICGIVASKISKIYSLRKKLEDIQRNFANKSENGAVLEGRDIGSIILPDANFKIFITATPEVRALRRFNQINSSTLLTDEQYSLEQIRASIIKRDDEDYSKDYAPLKIMHDAFLIDTSEIDFQLSFEEIIKYIEFKKIILSKYNKDFKDYEEYHKDEKLENFNHHNNLIEPIIYNKY
jgi:cytidylate kinase